MTGFYCRAAAIATDKGKDEVSIRKVWASNVKEEFDLIRQHLYDYRFVSFDTEFPGTIYGQYNKHAAPLDSYMTLKMNVDATDMIQLGLTLSNGSKFMVWEFNFNDFNLVRGDRHNTVSVQFLKEHGLDFDKTAKDGINSNVFKELLISSGLLGNNTLTWVGFHGATDFGYLIKILTQTNLPMQLDEFMQLVWKHFGTKTYDLKYMMRYCKGLYGGLNRVAMALNVRRSAGSSHQAGSDSLLTMQTYIKMVNLFFSNVKPEQLYNTFGGVLFGLNVRPVPLQTTEVVINHHGYYPEVAASEYSEPADTCYHVQTAC